MSERLQKILSHAGIASRRQSERLISEGRVAVNGEVVTTLGTKASSRDHISVDGKPLRRSRRPSFLLMYKPRGCVTTLSDPEGRPTVKQYLPKGGSQVFPVGRLDYSSEGLLLFTSDGDLAQALLRPVNGLPRVYLVKVSGTPDADDMARLKRPFRIDGQTSRGAHVEFRVRRRNSVLTVTLTEGKKHHVREMFKRVGHPVMRLRRVAFGPLRDPALRPGQTRRLTAEEVEALRSAVGQTA